MINKHQLYSITLVSAAMILLLISIAGAAPVVYVTNLHFSNTVSVINITNNTVISPSVTVRYIPFEAAITPKTTPALNITKSANLNNYSAVGQNITYTYSVNNTGNLNLTGNITIQDNRTIPFNITSIGLNISQNVTGTVNYTIIQADLDADNVTNLANATGSYNNQQVLSNNTTLTVPAIQTPALAIVKSAYPISYDAVGQTITYTYNVTNSGNVDISAPINVTDDKFGTVPIQSSGILSPGSSIT